MINKESYEVRKGIAKNNWDASEGQNPLSLASERSSVSRDLQNTYILSSLAKNALGPLTFPAVLPYIRETSFHVWS